MNKQSSPHGHEPFESDFSPDPEEIDAAVNSDSLSGAVASDESETQENLLTSWDDPPLQTGTAAPKVRPEDETPLAEKMISSGIEEADRETRIAAADPDCEP